MKNRIIKIEATLLTPGGKNNQYISWSRSSIGDMIELIPEKIEKSGMFANVKITHEK